MEIELLTKESYRDFFNLYCEWDKSKDFDFDIVIQGLDQQHKFFSRVFVARDGEDIVGYVQIAPGLHIGHDPFLEVVQILVSEKKRSTGVGHLLMERVEKIARAEGFQTIKLSSRVHRSKAHVFYECIGYELEKVSKFYKKIL
jgi:GNAT superfamily N-acetyltransferase